MPVSDTLIDTLFDGRSSSRAQAQRKALRLGGGEAEVTAYTTSGLEADLVVISPPNHSRPSGAAIRTSERRFFDFTTYINAGWELLQEK